MTAYVTCSCRKEAEAIARCVVTERLAACANLWEEMTSIYQWEGVLQTATEAVLLLKTHPDLGDRLVERVRQLHSYQCPCIILWESVGGNEHYLKWIHDETLGGKTSTPPPWDGREN